MAITCMYDAIVIMIILESPHGVRSCCKATSYRSVVNSKSFTMNLCKPPDPLLLTGNIVQNWKEFKEQLHWFLAGTESASKSDEIKIGIML